MTDASSGSPASATQVQAAQGRRFIEESFPVKEVGAASSKEKNIRHGHISTLHIWWARRPLAASRATAYAALTPYPATEEERENKKRFIIDLCQWENSNNQVLLDRARREILEANGGVPPKVLDPFAGGGSYPLEALRLGCETYSSDYNPVAVLIEKATLEYPQKFGRPFEGMPEWAKPQAGSVKNEGGRKKKSKNDKNEQPALFDPTTDSESTDFNPLVNAVRYWGERVLEETRKELAEFYPPDPDGSIPVGYIWARTIPCQNPACGEDIPLIRQFWLAKKEKKKVAFYPDTSSGKLVFRIVGDGYEPWPDGFDPESGTVKRAIATCPICGTVIDGNTTRRLFKDGKSSQRMVCVILANSRRTGKIYRVATDNDVRVYSRAEYTLAEKNNLLTERWGILAIPDEPTPEGKGSGAERAFAVKNYGMNQWGDLFNVRQKLSLVVFIEKAQQAYEKMLSERNTEFSKAVFTYLALTISRCADFESMLVRWFNHVENACNTFARQALGMTWDYFELNLLSTVSQGTYTNVEKQIVKALSGIVNTHSDVDVIVSQNSAVSLPFENSFFDAILTDPPYYDNVPYSYLSDFFYVWLKRIVGHIYPELFSTPLSPKIGEIVAYSNRGGGLEAGMKFFEENLKKSFQEMQRVLKPEGIATIVYAHKSTEGWETVINALIDSGLIVTGAWPLNTEMEGRLRASESAALASSIYIVARKMPRQPTGFYNDVRTELRQHLDAKLHRLWEEGIGGADFFIAAIGSAIEVFGKYEQVMDFEGNIVRADRLLEEVRTIATDYAVRQILHNGFAAEITGLTRLYVLWRWNYGEAIVPFDEARKLGQSCGIDISQEWSKTGFIRKEKEFIRMLGPQGRKLDDLDGPRDLIDVLHKSLLLWEKGQRAEMVQVLAEKGHGKSEAFYRVAQAISETLPNESREKKLLDGFLAGRERVQEEVEKAAEQGRLFE